MLDGLEEQGESRARTSSTRVDAPRCPEGMSAFLHHDHAALHGVLHA
jgi:hypothetical protein